ncbi:arylsulfatase [Colwelliaceae bacterium BS250]
MLNRSLYLFLLLTATGIVQASNLSKPNLIIIMADDLGFSDLGSYGGEIKTPNIDQLAYNGIRFTGFKNTSRCAPSRASLLTGRYQHGVGVGRMSLDENLPAYRGQISTDIPIIAEILQAKDYSTAIVGKWHLTNTNKSKQEKQYPLDRGFDFFHGTWWGAKDYFSPQFMMKNDQHLAEGHYPKDYYLTDDLSKSAIDFVDSQIKQKQPFFLYLAHYAPHAPIQAPLTRVQDIIARYKAGFLQLQRQRFERQKKLGVIPDNAKFLDQSQQWQQLNSADQNTWITTMATYAAMIEIMDEGIGHLIDLLKKSDLYDNTLIMVLSDNGSSDKQKGPKALGNLLSSLSNTPYRSHKAHTLEGGISSPFIVHWPKQLGQYSGQIRHGQVHINDILPTALDALAIDFPKTFQGKKTTPPDGISLINAIKGENVKSRPLFWEHYGRRAVYFKDWKLVNDGKNAPWQLFNLNTDPTEQHDLSKQSPERYENLKKMWMDWAHKNNVLQVKKK